MTDDEIQTLAETAECYRDGQFFTFNASSLRRFAELVVCANPTDKKSLTVQHDAKNPPDNEALKSAYQRGWMDGRSKPRDGDDTALLRQALEALEAPNVVVANSATWTMSSRAIEAISALRERLGEKR